jgi:hypothetical protein
MENINNQEQKIEMTASDVAKEIVHTKAQLDSVKPLYEQLDRLTLLLNKIMALTGQAEVFVQEQAVILPSGAHLVAEQYVKVVDNFSEKNTIFRPAGVKRFEAAFETVVERQVKEQKLMEKLKKATRQ